MMSPSATASTGSVERGQVGKTPTSGCARPSATARLMASGWSRMSMSRCPSTWTAATERRSTSGRSRSPALGGSREGTRSAIVRCSRKEALMNHNDTIRLFAKTLQNVERWMDKAAAQAKDLAGAEERKVSPPWLGGKWLRGDDYLLHIALPNFFFHATMAYAILRHNGVDLGKMDYIGSIPTKD